MISASLYDRGVGGDYYEQQTAEPKHVSLDQNPHYIRSDFESTSEKKDEITTSPRGCRDFVWAIIFYLHLAGFIAISVIYVPMFIQTAIDNNAANSGQRKLYTRILQNDDASDTEYNGNGGGGDDQQNFLQGFPVSPDQLLLIVCIAGSFSLLWSSLSMIFIISFADLLIKVSLCFNIIIFGFVASLSLVAGSVGGAVCSSVSKYSVTVITSYL